MSFRKIARHLVELEADYLLPEDDSAHPSVNETEAALVDAYRLGREHGRDPDGTDYRTVGGRSFTVSGEHWWICDVCGGCGNDAWARLHGEAATCEGGKDG